MTRTIWILDHGAAGHTAQAAGLADMAARQGWPITPHRLRVRPRIRGWMRGPLRSLAGALPEAAAGLLLGALHAPFERPDAPPDLLIGSGGSSAWALKALRAQTRAPAVFVGPCAPFSEGWFDAVLAPQGPNATEFLLSRMTPEAATAAAAARFANGAGPVWALLIGGRSRSHRYSAADWRALAAGVNAQAKRSGARWLIATSPRTGAEAEAILAEALDPEAVAELVLWGRAPDPCAVAYFGAAARVFVTRDSLTMVSEAVASGKPVTALRPEETRLEPGYLADTLADLAAQTWIADIPITALAEAADPPAGQADRSRLAAREKRIIATLAPFLN